MNGDFNQMQMQSSGGGGVGAIIFLLVYLGVIALTIASMWKVFAKAGKPGWAAIVPIYNIITLLEIAGKPTWWFVLFLIPIANFICAILVMMSLAQNFGKSSGFGLGLAFLGPVFFPMLAFGDAKYQGAGQAMAKAA